MITGDVVINDRKSRGLSRRQYVELLGPPWTESKLNNFEHGRREMKSDEAEVMERFMAGGPAAPPPQPRPALTQPAPAMPSMPAGFPTTAAPVSSYYDQRAQAVIAYNHVMERLAGKPAPPFGLPSAYRVDACPPEDLPGWVTWCQRVNQWLDSAAAGSYPFSGGGDTIEVIDEDEEVMWADVTDDGPVAAPPSYQAELEVLAAAQREGRQERIANMPPMTGHTITNLPAPPVTPSPVPVPVPVPMPPAQPASTPMKNASNQSGGSIGDVLPFPTHYQPEAPPTGPVGVKALYKDKLRRISNSEVQTFKHCRRRWWLGWYRGLRLKAEKRTGYAALGTRVHEALAGWYVPNGSNPVDPREGLEKIISRDESALMGERASDDSDTLIQQLAEFKKDADMARAMVEGYVEWVAETGIDSMYEVIAPEQVLEAVIEAAANHEFLLAGQLDVRVRRVHDNVNLLMDHKTVGDLNTPKLKLRLDEQMKTYILLEHEQGDGTQHVEGALYNMLKRSKRTDRATPPFYERVEITHNPQVIASFKERIKGEGLTINHVERCLNDTVPHHIIAFPSPSDQCRWRCEYTALCSMLDDGSRAEDFISEHYVAINPLDRYDKIKDEA